MPTSEKEQRVRELTEAIARSKSIVLANFTGMNVDLVTKMRRRLRDAHVEFIVEKNTLAKRALAGSGVKGLDPYLEGPTGMALGKDEIAGVKILAEFSKEFESRPSRRRMSVASSTAPTVSRSWPNCLRARFCSASSSVRFARLSRDSPACSRARSGSWWGRSTQ
jgi:hypothetical protein